MIGFDLTQDVPVEKQRAMMQRDKNFGWLTPDNQVVVLQPGQDITTYQYDSVTHKMTPLQLDESIVTRAHANAMWGSLAFKENFYTAQKSYELEK